MSIKRKIALVLAVMISLCAWTSASAYRAIPSLLRFTPSEETITRFDEHRETLILYPQTSRADVNETLASLCSAMYREAMPAFLSAQLPEGKRVVTLKVTTTPYRTGTRWMSFFTLATVDDATDQCYSAFDARTYDMQTGKELGLEDVLEDIDEVKPLVGDCIERYFPDEEPDAAAVCAALEDIENAPFTLTAGRLRFHFRASDFYKDKDTLLMAELYYPEISRWMTAKAREQTDNSAYKLIALTFDDGPARVRTTDTIDLLKRYGADATFFLVGERIAGNAFAVKYQHDSGFSQQSHSFSHISRRLNQAEVDREMRLFDNALCAMTGKTALLMRAPGGYERPYLEAKVNVPLINWTVASGDGTENRRWGKRGLEEIYERVISHACDGAVVLMHDLREQCPQYLQPILETLTEQDFLCVTVEELYSIRGETLLPCVKYHGLVKE